MRECKTEESDYLIRNILNLEKTRIYIKYEIHELEDMTKYFLSELKWIDSRIQEFEGP